MTSCNISNNNKNDDFRDAKFDIKKIRDCISQDSSENAVFACDVLSQPCYRDLYRKVDPNIHTKTSRALPIARSEDVVVLTSKLDLEYYNWLRSVGLGPENVAAYNQETPDIPLSDLILNNPEPVIKAIEKVGKKPVFVPFYSGSAEERAANILNAELFGSSEDLSLKYFSKDSFKQECMNLNIPMVGGESCSVPGLKAYELADIVKGLLKTYPAVLIRGSLGAAGSSAFKLSNSDVWEVLKKIRESKEDSLLIEPFLQVIASPNDQWAIGRNGDISHLGCSAQLFNELKHVGNLQGQYFSDSTTDYINNTSLLIVKNMAAHGYKGVLGIDYIVTKEGIFPIENNARMNGSSFTIAIVDNIEIQLGERPQCWKFFKAKVDPCSFAELTKKIEPILYTGTSVNSVFPYDCDTLAINGVFAPIVLAEDMYQLDFIEKTL